MPICFRKIRYMGPPILIRWGSFDSLPGSLGRFWVGEGERQNGKKEYLKYKDNDLKEFSKYDSDGTAKVAALSIKNSIKALIELQEYLPDYGVEILKLSSLLKKIFNELEMEFPDYNKFKRPGFDN